MTQTEPLPCTFRQLQYIVAVADLGGFRKAAEACGVAQPSLSAQVAQAESALGVQIFERGRNGARVAPGALGLVEQARFVLLAARDLATSARLQADPLRGTLRIGVIPTVCPYLLPDVAPALTRAYPELTLVWSEDKTAALTTALEHGSLDAAIVADGPDVSTLDRETIGVDPFVLAASPGHALLEGRAPATPKDLKGKTVFLLEDGHCFRDQTLALCAKSGASEVQYRATSLATLVQMVSAHQGVTLLPSLAVPVENRRGQLAVRPFASPGPSRTLVLAWRRGSALRATLEAVAARVREALPARPTLYPLAES